MATKVVHETKSVKVDNWGVFFLQKLQNFFNKTDYCDLTLQFLDNSQLKVHRLVMSACTDYFNLQELNSPVNGVIDMPYDLQADVVVPIVNFMYTGTLEFEVKMYGRLMKTARDMNMTVLLKLLEAHKRSVDLSGPTNRPAPVVLNKGAAQSSAIAPQFSRSGGQPIGRPATVGRPVVVAGRTGGLRRLDGTAVRGAATPTAASVAAASAAARKSDGGVKSPGGPQRGPQPRATTSANASLEDNGKPKDEHPFEQLRRGYTGVKRPPPSQLSADDSPPEKKPNLDEVKEYIEADRMRKKIVEEFHDDDDDELDEAPVAKAPAKGGYALEVMRKYPHLVKGNVKPGPKPTAVAATTAAKTPQQQRKAPEPAASSKSPAAAGTPVRAAAAVATAKPAVAANPTGKSSVANVVPAPANKARKIDSKTMHALIALGAENTTGPWLCLKCGINNRPISIPTYKGFRRHLINVHKLKIDPKLCEHCGWRSDNKNALLHHALVVHNVSPPDDVQFPKCADCSYVAVDEDDLDAHRAEQHAAKAAAKGAPNECRFCRKAFVDARRMLEHVKAAHGAELRRERSKAAEPDDELSEDQEEEYDPQHVQPKKPVSQAAVSDKKKINVLSSITLPARPKPAPVAERPPMARRSMTASSPGAVQKRGTAVAASAPKPGKVRSGTLDPATGAFVSDDEGDENAADEEEPPAKKPVAGRKSATAEPKCEVKTEAPVDDDPDSQSYLEYVMAEVHGEKKPGDCSLEDAVESDAKFLNEDGTTIELTEEQKKELIDQLHGPNEMLVIVKEEDAPTKAKADEDPDWEMEEPKARPAAKRNSVNRSRRSSVASGKAGSTGKATAVLSAKAKDILGDWANDDDDEEYADKPIEDSGKPRTQNDEEPEAASKGKTTAEDEEQTGDVSMDDSAVDTANMSADDEDGNFGADEPAKAPSGAATQKKEAAIKALINDWDDDDDEDDQ